MESKSVEYIDRFGARYRIMKQIGGDRYQAWRKAKGGAIWMPFSTPKASREEAQEWLGDEAALSDMRVYTGGRR